MGPTVKEPAWLSSDAGGAQHLFRVATLWPAWNTWEEGEGFPCVRQLCINFTAWFSFCLYAKMIHFVETVL